MINGRDETGIREENDMDKYEYNVKLEQIKKLIRKKDYATAARIADTIDWYKVKNNQTIVMIADVYEASGRYEQAKENLKMAYDRSGLGRQIAYKLVKICIKCGDIEEAEDFYDDFVSAAPRDISKYLLQYELAKAKGEPIEDQIAILEQYLEEDMDDRWAFELAKLYHKSGQRDKCIEQCDTVMLWFSDGKYVDKAMDLKMIYTPLTKSQQERYEARWREKSAQNNIKIEEIKVKEVDVANKYNTQNIQNALKESMDEIFSREESRKSDEDRIFRPAKSQEDVEYKDAQEETEIYDEAEETAASADDYIYRMAENALYQESRQGDGTGATLNGMEVAAEEDFEEESYGGSEDNLGDTKVFFTTRSRKNLGDTKVFAPQRVIVPEQVAFEEPEVEQGAYILEEKTIKKEPEEEPGEILEMMQEKAEETAEEPVEETVEESVEEAAEEPVEEAVEEPAEEAVEESVEKAVEEPVEEAVEEPVEETVEESVEEIAGTEEGAVEIAEEPVEEIEESVEVLDQIAEEISEKPMVRQISIDDFFNDAEEYYYNTDVQEDVENQEAEEEIEEPEIETGESAIEEEPEEEIEEPEIETGESAIEEEPEEEIEEPEIETGEFAIEEEPEEEIEEPEIETGEPEMEEEPEVELEESEMEEKPEPEIDQEEPGMEEKPEPESEEGLEEEIEEIEEPEEKFREEIDPFETVTNLKIDKSQIKHDYKEEPDEEEEQDKVLTNEEIKEIIKDFIGKYSGVQGLDKQMLKTLQNVIVDDNCNIFIMGDAKSGKTSLGIDIIKVVNKIKRNNNRRIAKISGDKLIGKELSVYFAKLRGSDLFIENVSLMDDTTVEELLKALETDIDNRIVVIEDEKINAEKFLEKHSEINNYFVSRIVVRQNKIKDWVEVAKDYAQDQGYQIDEMGLLALHARIDQLYGVTLVIQKNHVEAIIDNAIKKTEKGGLFKKLFGKKKEKVLTEEHFN